MERAPALVGHQNRSSCAVCFPPSATSRGPCILALSLVAMLGATPGSLNIGDTAMLTILLALLIAPPLDPKAAAKAPYEARAYPKDDRHPRRHTRRRLLLAPRKVRPRPSSPTWRWPRMATRRSRPSYLVDRRQRRGGARRDGGGGSRRPTSTSLTGFDGWLYDNRTEQGKQYPIYTCKRLRARGAVEQVLLDLNELAKRGEKFLGGLARFSVSDDGNLLSLIRPSTSPASWLYDDCASRTSAPARPCSIVSSGSNSPVWSADGKTLFSTSARTPPSCPYQLRRHVLGSTGPDPVVYEDEGRASTAFSASRRSHGQGLSLLHLAELRDHRGPRPPRRPSPGHPPRTPAPRDRPRVRRRAPRRPPLHPHE